MNKITLLYTTVGEQKDADHLAELAISSKLAICVNIVSNGKSIYLWNGAIEQSNELYMLFKTTPECINELEQLITKKHPYEVPAILKWECTASNAFYKYGSDVMKR